jgi:CDP-diacylglycerol--glycerol-3-phosphate 3-phosphatidyltransferase
MTWTSAFGRGCKVLLHAIVHGLALTRISPNVLTFIGLLINTAAAFLFGYATAENQQRMFLYAGLVIIGAGIFDMVIDRYSDVALYFGLLVYYARANRFFYVVLTALVMVTSLMISYTRARSENMIKQCKVGFMERPERIVLVIIGALFNRMAAILWVIAVIGNITVIHRIGYTYEQTRERDLEAQRTQQPQPIELARP